MKEDYNQETALEGLTLGKSVAYVSEYDASLLQPVPRSLSRDKIGLHASSLPFTGVDIWTGYELSWLTAKGKPQVALLECRVPISSPNLIESKSFKLYLNSFNQTRFNSVTEVQQHLIEALSACAGETVEVEIILPDAFNQLTIAGLPGKNIDDLDITVEHYAPVEGLLKTASDAIVTESLNSNLLKSNCLITNQPDWASLYIHYQGPQIDHESLLRYIISFRQHNEFHEQCVERIYSDLLKCCQPTNLTVYARYTRRGGLDINPFRTNFEEAPKNTRDARQ